MCADDPERYGRRARWAPGRRGGRARPAARRCRRAPRHVPGVTVIIYDQRCAAEARRLRKRGLLPEPPRRVVINEAVCEGCGDCSAKSNCLSVLPVETEFGEKRQIHDPSCNRDYTCLEGDCPSFVTITPKRGGRRGRRRVAPARRAPPVPPCPRRPADAAPAAVRSASTASTSPGSAARAWSPPTGSWPPAAEAAGLVVGGMDQTGLSQKAGAVVSHLHLATRHASALGSPAISAGGADLYLSGDILQAVERDAPGQGRARAHHRGRRPRLHPHRGHAADRQPSAGRVGARAGHRRTGSAPTGSPSSTPSGSPSGCSATTCCQRRAARGRLPDRGSPDVARPTSSRRSGGRPGELRPPPARRSCGADGPCTTRPRWTPRSMAAEAASESSATRLRSRRPRPSRRPSRSCRRRAMPGRLARDLLVRRTAQVIDYQDTAPGRPYLDLVEMAATPRRPRTRLGAHPGGGGGVVQAAHLQRRVRGGPAAPRSRLRPGRRRARASTVAYSVTYHLHPPVLRRLGLPQAADGAALRGRLPGPAPDEAAAGNAARPVRPGPRPPDRTSPHRGVRAASFEQSPIRRRRPLRDAGVRIAGSVLAIKGYGPIKEAAVGEVAGRVGTVLARGPAGRGQPAVIKRIRFATRRAASRRRLPRCGGPQARGSRGAGRVRPDRVAVCTSLPEVLPGPKHDGIAIEWFADTAHFAASKAGCNARRARRSPTVWSAPCWSPAAR